MGGYAYTNTIHIGGQSEEEKSRVRILTYLLLKTQPRFESATSLQPILETNLPTSLLFRKDHCRRLAQKISHKSHFQIFYLPGRFDLLNLCVASPSFLPEKKPPVVPLTLTHELVSFGFFLDLGPNGVGEICKSLNAFDVVSLKKTCKGFKQMIEGMKVDIYLQIIEKTFRQLGDVTWRSTEISSFFLEHPVQDRVENIPNFLLSACIQYTQVYRSLFQPDPVAIREDIRKSRVQSYSVGWFWPSLRKNQDPVFLVLSMNRCRQINNEYQTERYYWYLTHTICQILKAPDERYCTPTSISLLPREDPFWLRIPFSVVTFSDFLSIMLRATELSQQYKIPETCKHLLSEKADLLKTE